MTRQQKIEHLERKGYKVKNVYSSANPNGKILLESPNGTQTAKDSVNQAHALIFGY